MSKTRELLKVESITEFVPLVAKLCGSGSFGSVWIFRGQGHRRETWPLLPKAGRADFFHPNNPTELEWEFLERYGYTRPLDMAVCLGGA